MTSGGRKIRVLVVDDQRLVRDGIASLLGLDEEIAVIGQPKTERSLSPCP